MASQSIHKNLPGTRREAFNNWQQKNVEEMESSLCIQQWIQQQIAKDPSDMDAILGIPSNTEASVWQYEHIRQFLLELNHLLTHLATCCTKSDCPLMEACGQEFLCAAHVPPAECCAIDYMCHTLDKFTTFIHNPTFFPGRLNVPSKSAAQFSQIIRRLYRLFLHAEDAHQAEFEEFEEKTFLCKRFSVFAKQNGFLDDSQLTIEV